MHTSDINTSTHRSDHLKNSAVQNAEPVAPDRAVSEEKQEARADRIEISNEARSASRSSEDLSFARNALHSVPELSESRTSELTERIKSGYYNKPDVLQHIAERLGNELAGGSL